MRRILKWLGTIPLFAVVGLCLAPTLIPPFLDRIYYRGPVSDHYDGHRFFNPEGEPQRLRGNSSRFFNRWVGGERAAWPAYVPVDQTVPPSRVDGTAMHVTWIGHSTVLVQAAGINILTDPVWSHRVSPFSFIGPTRVREPGVAIERLPRIDLILVSHNHYDHLDLPTLERLWQRDHPLIVTSLGNDTILAERGIRSVAGDWGARVPVRPGVEVLIERNHHWDSRWGTDRNRALWSAFTVRLPGGNLFFGGDTGFGDGGWVRLVAAHGPFRLALIPIGTYEPRDFMHSNHVDPDEAVGIYQALHPVMGLGIHWGTFQLSFEAIDDPPQRLAVLRRAAGPSVSGFITTDAGESFDVPEVRPAAAPAG